MEYYNGVWNSLLIDFSMWNIDQYEPKVIRFYNILFMHKEFKRKASSWRNEPVVNIVNRSKEHKFTASPSIPKSNISMAMMNCVRLGRIDHLIIGFCIFHFAGNMLQYTVWLTLSKRSPILSNNEK